MSGDKPPSPTQYPNQAFPKGRMFDYQEDILAKHPLWGRSSESTFIRLSKASGQPQGPSLQWLSESPQKSKRNTLTYNL